MQRRGRSTPRCVKITPWRNGKAASPAASTVVATVAATIALAARASPTWTAQWQLRYSLTHRFQHQVPAAPPQPPMLPMASSVGAPWQSSQTRGSAAARRGPQTATGGATSAWVAPGRAHTAGGRAPSSAEKASDWPVSVAAVAAAAGAAAASQTRCASEWFVRARPTILVVSMVLQKVAVDALTWYTRTRGPTAYSGSSAALVSEALKFPLLAVAIALFQSPNRVWPCFRDAVTDAPFALCWVGAAYAVQNVLYFFCLDHISAAAYQILSQSKLLFTAGLMSVMLQKRFSRTQMIALALLFAGTIATQFGETTGSAKLAIGHGSVLLGCALTILSSALSALPNVFYEGVLKKEKEDEWVRNVQLTTWVLLWVMVCKVASGESIAPVTGLAGGGSGVGMIWGTCAELTKGFTPMVWLITALKSMNCILVPACLKYADNIAMSYAKPMSIVITIAVTAMATCALPTPELVAGTAMVLFSIALYSRG